MRFKLSERTDHLKGLLTAISSDKDRPNNSLEAKTSLLIIRMSQTILDHEYDKLSDIWNDFSSILDQAAGFGEFNADRLVSIIEASGQFAGNNSAYNDLIEKMAQFVSNRKSEAEGALILLKRAEKLDLSDNFDIIRLLGKATISLTKKEYNEDLIDALWLLTLAYRSAGLLWAARATCILLSASIVIGGEEESELPTTFIPTMKIWAWVSFELEHLPDFLLAIQMLNGALSTLPIAEESRKKIQENFQELDIAFGSKFLNLNKTELGKLETLPDILEKLGLFTARSCLLYALGHFSALRADGSIPETESDEDANTLFSTIANQPVSENQHGKLIHNAGDNQILRTKIVGLTVELKIQASSFSITVSEAILSSLEAFFATALEYKITPHTERLHITLNECDKIQKPRFELNQSDMTGIITWPRSFRITDFERQEGVIRFLTELSGEILAGLFASNNTEGFLEKLFADEAVHHRMTTAILSFNSYNRISSRLYSQLSDWHFPTLKSYDLQEARPTLSFTNQRHSTPPKAEDNIHSESPPSITDHRSLEVSSIIDIHSWNQARWKGTAYIHMDLSKPPYMAFLFENEQSAKKIFERWRHRFGEHDQNEDISLSIIRELPKQNPNHYCVLLHSKPPEKGQDDRITTVATRSSIMEPDNNINLERFLKSYQYSKSYYIMPAILKETTTPELLFELSILKKDLTVKSGKDVKEHDIESIAFRKSSNQ